MENGLDLAAILRGALVAAALAIVAAGACALLLNLGPGSAPGAASVASAVVLWLAVLVAGLASARSAGRSGLLHGALAGGAFIVLALLVGRLGFGLIPSMSTVSTRFLLGLAVGAIGGALGLVV